MHLNLLDRAAQDCKTGTQWYICSANGFKGCCSVDPCNLSNCPDSSASPSSSASLTTLTLTPQPAGSAPTSTSASTSTSSSASATTTSQVTSTTLIVESLTSSTSSSIATSTQSPASTRSSSPSKAPVIAGAVCGIVAASILSILVWFLLRKRRQQRKKDNSESKYVEGKKYSLERGFSSEEQRFRASDVFAPFGGRHKTPTPDARRASRHSQCSHDTPQTSNSPEPQNRHLEPEQQSLQQSEEEQQDAPLPDVEKSSLTPPPAHEHPAYHPLPGHSPDIPTYHPGHKITSPEMAGHPAFLAQHPSLMSQHPAFRTSSAPPLDSPSSSSSRPHVSHAQSSSNVSALSTLPSQRRAAAARGAESTVSPNPSFMGSEPRSKRRHCSYMPTRTTSQLDSTEVRRKSSMPTIHNQIPFTSPIPGRSELPAEVPAAFASPIGQSFSYNDLAARFGEMDISRDNSTNTAASTYSIPIGLGLSHSSSVHQNAPLYPVDEDIIDRAASAPIPLHMEHEEGDEREPLGPNPKRSSSSLGKGKEHVMAWATYGYGGVQTPIAEEESPILGKRRSEEERWSGSTAHTETPLNEMYRHSWVDKGIWTPR